MKTMVTVTVTVTITIMITTTTAETEMETKMETAGTRTGATTTTGAHSYHTRLKIAVRENTRFRFLPCFSPLDLVIPPFFLLRIYLFFPSSILSSFSFSSFLLLLLLLLRLLLYQFPTRLKTRKGQASERANSNRDYSWALHALRTLRQTGRSFEKLFKGSFNKIGH